MFHLAAAVNGECEADFDLGMRSKPDTRFAVASPARAIEGLLSAVQSSPTQWGPRTSMTSPGLMTTVRDTAQALERVAGPAATTLLDWQTDAAIEKIVNAWPGNIHTHRALAMGLDSDVDFEQLIRAYVCENPHAFACPPLTKATCREFQGCIANGFSGKDTVVDRIAQRKAAGVGIAIVDAISNDDLMRRLAPELKAMPLVTAGSGTPIGLPQNFGVAPSQPASVLPKATGLQAVVSGSCSLATNAQVRAFVKAGLPALAVDPLKMASGTDVAAEALAWAAPLLQAGPVLVYSTAESAATKAEQSQLGTKAAGASVERTLAAIAKGLVALGVRQLLVAGGETSGACVQAVGITQMHIDPQIAPGVLWCCCAPPRSVIRVSLPPKAAVPELARPGARLLRAKASTSP